MALRLIRRFCTKSKGPAPRECNKASTDKSQPPNETSPKCGPPKDLSPPKGVKVSLQGADCKAGQMAAFLLKQHPLITKVYLHGQQIVENIATDLNCIDTSCKIEAYHGENNIARSLRAADIAILIDTDRKDERVDRKFDNSAPRVAKFAEQCSIHCPRAVIVMCVEPVCCMLPLVQKIFEETPWYHPAKLVGSVATLQARINAAAGNFLNLDPNSIHVPLLGGPDAYSVVPLLSIMTPDPGLSPRDQETFYEMLKRDIAKKDDMRIEKSTLNEGYAIARMAITIAKGLCGHDDAIATAFTRTNHVDPLKYLVTTVRFGEGGIYDNYGIPKMTRFELEQFEDSILTLEKRQKHFQGRDVKRCPLKICHA